MINNSFIINFIPFLPLLVILTLLIIFKMSVSKAALITLMLTIGLAFKIYGVSIDTVVIELCKGLWSSLPIILVVLSAVTLYEILYDANALKVVSKYLKNISNNELFQILVIGCVFVSYLQGITGFGVPILVGAPLLASIGVKPVYSIIIVAIGYAWSNTYGTLAAAWDALIQITETPVNSIQFFNISLWTCLLLIVVNAVCCLCICWLYGGLTAIKKGLPAVIAIVLSQSVLQLVIGQINTSVAAFLSTTVSMVVVLGLGKTKMYQKYWRNEGSKIMNRQIVVDDGENNIKLLDTLFPFLILTLITIICLLVKPVNSLLEKVMIGLYIPTITDGTIYYQITELYSSFNIFTHPSTFLFLTSVITYIYYRRKKYIKESEARSIVKRINKKVVPSAISIVCLMMMAKIMIVTGMTEKLALTVSNLVGNNYAFISPYIGLLGTFVTGSNMSSNILFANFQQTTASMLNVNQNILLASQTAGAAMGGAISPSNISLGTISLGIVGKEGEVLKKTVYISLIVVAIIGTLLFIIT